MRDSAAAQWFPLQRQERRARFFFFFFVRVPVDSGRVVREKEAQPPLRRAPHRGAHADTVQTKRRTRHECKGTKGARVPSFSLAGRRVYLSDESARCHRPCIILALYVRAAELLLFREVLTARISLSPCMFLFAGAAKCLRVAPPTTFHCARSTEATKPNQRDWGERALACEGRADDDGKRNPNYGNRFIRAITGRCRLLQRLLSALTAETTKGRRRRSCFYSSCTELRKERQTRSIT